uniref:Uncharacterized protein n=1 Tax=Panagrolaimus superbus TaxID=310955 RepID=A0A914XPT2_9BILA
MIAYLLKYDLTKKQIAKYHYECPFVSLRYFNDTKCPYFVKNLNEYRWKPIIISDVLQEVENVLYFDSSIVFQNQANESIKDIFEKMNTNFSKCGLRLFGTTSHTIFAATNPKMLDIFNFSKQTAQAHLMYSASSLFLTPKSLNIVSKWNECALEKACMAPEGSQIYCNNEKLRNGKYANCHRFDQSALALLTLQCKKPNGN